MISGIYTIINSTNGKVYIGSSINVRLRWHRHLVGLENNRHWNKHLQSSWNKDGKEKFRFELIEEVTDRDKLSEREQHWIDIKKSYLPSLGYNFGRYSDCPTRGKQLGPLSEIRKQKMRGKKHSEETKRKISILSVGIWKNPEYREKTCLGMRQRWSDQEQREKASRRMSLVVSKLWKNSSYRKKVIEGLTRRKSMDNQGVEYGRQDLTRITI